MKKLPVSIGLDGVHCTIFLKKQAENVHPIDKNLKNSDGTVYGNIKSKGENIKLTFNLPLMIREYNLIPFGLSDKSDVGYIKNKLMFDLKRVYGENIKYILPNAIEVNVTKRLYESSVSDVLRLIRYAYLKDKEQLSIWVNKGENACKEITTGVLTQTIINEYRLKAYDKSKQMRLSGVNVDNDIIRLELIFQGRRIRQALGRECSVFDVLDNYDILIDLFEHKFNHEVKEKIRKFLSSAKNEMFECLTNGEKSKDVFSKYRDAIVDSKQIQKAMERFYIFTGQQDKSRTFEKIFSKSLGIKTGTINEFGRLLKE